MCSTLLCTQTGKQTPSVCFEASSVSLFCKSTKSNHTFPSNNTHKHRQLIYCCGFSNKRKTLSKTVPFEPSSPVGLHRSCVSVSKTLSAYACLIYVHSGEALTLALHFFVLVLVFSSESHSVTAGCMCVCMWVCVCLCAGVFWCPVACQRNRTLPTTSPILAYSSTFRGLIWQGSVALIQLADALVKAFLIGRYGSWLPRFR